MSDSPNTPHSAIKADLLTQIRVTLPFEQADQLSDQLLEMGALVVSLEDAHANSDEEQPLFGEPGLEPESAAWNLNHVIALFRNLSEAQQVMGEVPVSLLNDQAVHYESVPEQDWVQLTQSQFDPIRITDRLWIVPTWHQPEMRHQRVNLILDPGLAFGTGSHPTTALCLSWLCDANLRNKAVLDYGCGSGILGIASLLLGASEAVGVDIDPQAVQSTADNAAQNGVSMPVGLPGFELARRQFPIVVANILSNPLKVLAPSLCELIQPSGEIVLSGVLARQAEEVMAIYREWVDIQIWAEREGWVCLYGKKKAV